MMDGVVPDTFGLDRLASCLMVYDWHEPIGSNALDRLEACFNTFGQPPLVGTGHLDDKKSHGAFRRVRKRLAEFLDEYQESCSLGVKLECDLIDERKSSFATMISASIGASRSGERSASIAVDESHVSGPNDLVDAIASTVFEVTGPCYGGAFRFPVMFGPDGYRVSVGMAPRGVHAMANRAYMARITRWRDNLLHRKLRPSSGFFREVYPINFLLSAHLNMPFRDTQLSEFMQANGTLSHCGLQGGMYRWDVPEESLDDVREALEPSGLILSSPAKPLSKN